MDYDRRAFLKASSSAAFVGAAGCGQAPDALWPLTGLPEKPPTDFTPPSAGSIDLTSHVINRLTFGPTPGLRTAVLRLAKRGGTCRRQGIRQPGWHAPSQPRFSVELIAMKQTKAYLHGNGDLQKTLVVVFLRGGADGLALVPAVGDEGYHRQRPRIAISEKEVVCLDDRFGLNPLMNALKPAVEEGALTTVHCVGSEDDTRSHFEAQDRKLAGSGQRTPGRPGGLTRNDELSRCAPPCPNATRTLRRHGQGFS